MSCIRVGSVGIGGISRHVHLPGIERSPDLKLVAVCDIDPEALRYAQEKYGIDEAHCFTDYHDLINCPMWTRWIFPRRTTYTTRWRLRRRRPESRMRWKSPL